MLGCRKKLRQIRKSKEEDCRRQKWAKREDGDFRWKNPGATKLVGKRRARWENPVVGGSLTRPRAPVRRGLLPEKDTCVTALRNSVVGVLAFSG